MGGTVRCKSVSIGYTVERDEFTHLKMPLTFLMRNLVISTLMTLACGCIKLTVIKSTGQFCPR